MQPVITPRQNVPPVGDNGLVPNTWYLYFTAVTGAIVDFIKNAVYGRPNLTHVGRLTKVASAGTIDESAITDDGATVTVAGRDVVIAGDTTITGDVAITGDSTVTGDVNVTGDVAVTGAVSVIGARPSFEAITTGGTQPARFGKLVNDNNLYWTINLSYDGTNWNLDDTGNAGQLIVLSGGSLIIATATAGANPRVLSVPVTLNGTYAVDVTGDINASGVFRVAGVSGVSGSLTLTKTTQTVQYKDWAGVNQSVSVVTNVTLTSNAFTGGIRTA